MRMTAALENKCVLHIQYRQIFTETINSEKRSYYPRIHNATLKQPLKQIYSGWPLSFFLKNHCNRRSSY